MGYKRGYWEFGNISKILKDIDNLGGIDNLIIAAPDFIVSDDTILNIASGEG
jgi:hypothetical protein